MNHPTTRGHASRRVLLTLAVCLSVLTGGLAAGITPARAQPIEPPTIVKSFGAATIPVGGTTSLTFTITNPNSAATLTGVAFTDTLPAGLVVATPNGLTSNTCAANTVTATAGSGTISLSGEALNAGAQCTFSVNVTGTTAGVKSNSVTVTSDQGTGNTSTATLTATAHAGARTVFVALGDTSTTCPDAPNPTTQSYPALLAHHLRRGAVYRNLAINNDDIDLAGVISTQLPAALRARPTLVVIWVIFHNLLPEATSPTVYRRELDELLAPLHRAHAHVFIANAPDMRTFPSVYLPDPTARRQYVRRGQAFNAAIAAVASRRGAIVVNMYAATRPLFSHPGYVVPPYGRFNARGCAAVASIFYRVMHSHGAL